MGVLPCPGWRAANIFFYIAGFCMIIPLEAFPAQDCSQFPLAFRQIGYGFWFSMFRYKFIHKRPSVLTGNSETGSVLKQNRRFFNGAGQQLHPLYMGVVI